MLICPNPKCRREIAEPIMLTVLSSKPPKQYEACPFCFTELEKPEQKEEMEQEELQEETEEATESPEFEEEDEEELEAEEILETEDDYLPETEAQEPVKESGSGFLGKVRALIPSNGSKKEAEKKNEEPEVEEAYEDDEDYDEELEDFAVVEEETIELSEEPEEDFEADEYKEETAKTEELESEPEIKQSARQESEQEGCPEEFGYLANRPKDSPIPQVCFVCPKMVDCMLSTRDD